MFTLKWFHNEVMGWLQNELNRVAFGLQQVQYSSILITVC